LDPFGLSIITGDVDATAEEVEADSATFTLMGERFDPLGGYAYLLFVLIYFPCVAAFGATVQEMGTKLGIILAGLFNSYRLGHRYPLLPADRRL
jgi:ferrous iron transport protein B